MPFHPTLKWAQNKDVIFLTVELSDITNPEIDVKPEKFHFKGKGEKEQKEYEAELEFHGKIDVEKSKKNLTARELFIVLQKAEQGFWPKLQKGGKLNFLKTDFARWKDEDDDDEEDQGQGDMGGMGGMDFSSILSQAGVGSQPDLDNYLPDGDESSDEEEAEKSEGKN
ncbi:Prostaglandin E synthase 3 (Cytosolic) [Apophysomyces ossiformis]|uniref:Prostaglandin E synthase 3 (Cytosolic) n=1 Tax=Apophysomyces ossiformis TaxID=679940 RepID=A0A8H7BNF8_9FUNG|nr:Prostaglandin E synthase 3 (Cytosolic) [Apophysomyces ossiformis]